MTGIAIPRAAIDIGTNTLRFIVADVKKGIKIISEGRRIVRLGEGLKQNGRISESAMDRTVSCLYDFSKQIELCGIKPSEVRAVATSGVREAANSQQLLDKAQNITGIKIRIISGEEEGNITMLGIKLGLGEGKKRTGINSHTPPEDFVAIDIGGGSTEFIFSDTKTPTRSLNLGIVHLAEKFLKNDPPSTTELDNLQRELERADIAIPKEIKEMAGTAGTVTTLAFIDSKAKEYRPEMINNYILTRNSIQSLYDKMITMNNKQKRESLRIEKGREDIIIPGMLILLTIMKKFEYNHIHVSDYGLREGLLIQ